MYWGTGAVLELVTAPAVEPVGIDDVKAHSRVGITADNLLLQDKIVGMRMMVEKNNDLALITQTWKLSLQYLPCEISIYKWPVQSITHIKYLDSASVLQTLSSALYLTDLRRRPPRIVQAPGATWPSTVEPRSGAVVVEFKAGYGDSPDDVPQNIRDYLLVKIADAYENRESSTPGQRYQQDFVENLIASEKLHSL